MFIKASEEEEEEEDIMATEEARLGTIWARRTLPRLGTRTGP